jgi:uncharacterized membrane protein YhaH (DUF805 family)
MLYGVLLVVLINALVRADVSLETRESWPVFIPLLAANVVGVIAALYCLFTFLGHLSTENRRLGKAGKALWFALLLLGSVATMPVYWYWEIVRQRITESAGSSARPSDGAPTS